MVTRVAPLTWALLQEQALPTLVPYGVVRQLVEAGQLAVIEPWPAIPFGSLGLLMPEQDTTAAMRTFADFVEAFARNGPTENTR